MSSVAGGSSGDGGSGTRETAGRYEFVVELGSSVIGEHWAGRVADGAETGRLVSLRRIRKGKGGASDDRTVQQISEAAFAAMEVRHSNVAAVLDVVVSPDDVTIVSEYVEGEFLRGLQRQAAQRRTPIAANVGLKIVYDALCALIAARDAWYDLVGSTDAGAEDDLATAVHGGVSPQTILVASFGETMLADVGIAGSLLAAHVRSLHTGLLPYCAPELLEDKRGRCDDRADVFSFGVLLWELLANAPLFGSAAWFRSTRPAAVGGAEGAAIKTKVLKGEIQRLDQRTQAGAPIKAALVELVERALSRDLSLRFQSLEDLKNALQDLGADAFAAPEQVAATVERLARMDLDARRMAIDIVAGEPETTDSAPPESGRPTYRPPAGTEAQRIVPKPLKLPGSGGTRPLIIDSSPPSDEDGFSENERPTSPGPSGASIGSEPRLPVPSRPKKAKPHRDDLPKPAGSAIRPLLGSLTRKPNQAATAKPKPPLPKPRTVPVPPVKGVGAQAQSDEPESIEPESIEPESIEPESIEPESIEPESVELEALDAPPAEAPPTAPEPEAPSPTPSAESDTAEGHAPFDPTGSVALESSAPDELSPSGGLETPIHDADTAPPSTARSRTVVVIGAVVVVGAAAIGLFVFWGAGEQSAPADPGASNASSLSPSKQPNPRAPSNPSTAASVAQSPSATPADAAGATPEAPDGGAAARDTSNEEREPLEAAERRKPDEPRQDGDRQGGKRKPKDEKKTKFRPRGI